VNRELIDRLRAATDAVFADTRIYLAYAYGSRIYGTPRPGSDMDIAYYADSGDESLIAQFERALALEAELCKRTALNVDLRDLRRAPLELRGRVIVEGVRIYCRDRVKQVNLERDTLSRYQDYKDSFDRMHMTRLQNMAAGGL
jgi:predicted nucleotidyltransferase